MKQYRTVTMPVCPYCSKAQEMNIWSDNYGTLVKMVDGRGSSDVVLKCEHCGEKYRVTCNIRFFSNKNI